MGSPLIEDHALIGDLRCAALVSREGEIDWLCMPDFDSDACFASLLGDETHGRWKISPAMPVLESRRRYRDDTLILETDFVTAGGMLRLTDFMVPRSTAPQLVRSVECLQGEVPVHTEFSPRLAFGRAVPRVTRDGDLTSAIVGPDALYLRGGPTNGAPEPSDDFVLKAGAKTSFVLTWGKSYEPPPEPVATLRAEAEAERFWVGWCSQLEVPSRYRDIVVRSLITLKACSYEQTGGMVAAPTTSLPETPGGIRNWDYRFTWLRDSSLAVRAFMNAGLTDEALAFREWMLRAVAGDPSQIQIMYGLRGERRLLESELPWLPGYEGAKPVRVGNGAYDQFQLDVFGEIAEAMRFGHRKFKRLGPTGLQMLVGIADFVAARWRDPDRGIWEMRGPERSFTASKVSAWVALNDAIEIIEKAGLSHPLEEIRRARDAIFAEVCEKGFNAEKNSFTQYYGGTELDASLLFIPLSGFLPATDPRVVGTVAALERDLLRDGLLLRFRPVEDIDGLSGEEGVFLACSFWLANTYFLMGRTEEARRLFDRLVGLANDVGLLAEEYDPARKRHLGNFPQAFTHFALVNCAYLLEGMDPTLTPASLRH